MSAFELQAFQRSVYQARITLASCELDEATDFAEALADERTTLTEAALGAFIINLRRRAYGEQAYLRNTIEPRTDGCSDILAEQTMFDLAETVVADNRELYVESLAEIHRALHCVSMNEALALSEAMAAAESAGTWRAGEENGAESDAMAAAEARPASRPPVTPPADPPAMLRHVLLQLRLR